MAFQGDSIYWVEVEKVVPNPFQPRREFDESKLQELGESIRMYGVLQPLTVTRQEVQNDDGTFFTQYELIAGERRLRASRLAGVAQVPVIIREGEDSEQEKLELAIIENLQREDLNAIDRALAFQQLADQFNLSHAQVGKKVGRSREYVANSIRLLQLPEHMMESVRRGELGEGHARTLLMLSDKPEEQETLFRETLLKKLSVRELERITRKIAVDKVRKPNASDIDQHLIEIERAFTETLGTRVQIQKTEFGGKLTIDYFSDEDLAAILERMRAERAAQAPTSAAVVQTHSPATYFEQPASPSSSDAFAHAGTTAQATTPAAPTSSYGSPNPQPATQNSTQANVSAEPAPAAPAPEPTATPPASPNSAADQSLLERLAAHTHLSFTPSAATEPEPTDRPTPGVATNDETVTGAPAAQSVAETHSHVSQSNLVSGTPVSELPAEPGETERSEPAATKETTSDDDQDLYSLRNFTV